ncbi:MAG: dienelactone hydrolase-related enzyme [Pseudotabrizicola sp.]|uniref:alpha/beta hydrolase family protein n=1 Tax=Pseudotabrizicola sp. TaxID=2939647 RepID=UPI002717F1F7|nr:dienelactone hydrolase-related enzyme [Pseudotabrizicola sp.]MDO9641214.1 dienelactone hydrolase-related enzyme [Pseudotabrizicola sp.]
MFHEWLDRWDERRTRRRDDVKIPTEPVLDAERAFPTAKDVTDLEGFCAYAEEVIRSSDVFFAPSDDLPEVGWQDGMLSFRSDLSTGMIKNDMVHAKVTKARSSDHAVLVFHHWNASARNAQLARLFAGRGITVFEMAMPYHLERTRPGSLHADLMLSPNLGMTIQSVRQAVIDGRQLIRIAQHAGYRKISVVGISLGSWVAGLVAAHDPVVEKASLLLTGGHLADMVWTGGATRHIRTSFEGQIELAELKRAWAPLSLESYAAKLARPALDLQIVLASRDKVVLPTLSDRFVKRLQGAGASPDVKRLNCGHYSLTLPPFIIYTGMSALRFLNR